MDWDDFREQFPVTLRWTYLDHAAVAPLPNPCRMAMAGCIDEVALHGCARYERVLDGVKRTRRLGAELLHTRPERVFFVRSTSQGIGVAAQGLPVRPGDNVVLVEREFPANFRPWRPLGRKGVELRFVPQREGRVLVDDIAARVDARTRAVSVSFVQFLSGYRMDLAPLAEVCRRVDALFVVDAIQGLGVFDLDVEALGVDVLSADGHKWLLGPEGAGLGFVSDRARERLELVLEGWLSVERPFDFFDADQPLKASASRYEEGAMNVTGIHGLGGSLGLLMDMGTEALSKRVLGLTDRLADGLGRFGWRVLSPRSHDGEKSGIVLADRPGMDITTLKEDLWKAGIVASVRGGGLRLSPHAYNTTDEIDEVVETLGRLSGERAK